MEHENRPPGYGGYGGENTFDDNDVEPLMFYSNREMSRLWSFEHMVRAAHDMARNLQNNIPSETWWIPEDETKCNRYLLWADSWRMVHAMQESAFHMYEGHTMEDDKGNTVRIPGFIDDPRMKEAADDILNRIKKEKEEEKAEELHRLEKMWRNGI